MACIPRHMRSGQAHLLKLDPTITEGGDKAQAGQLLAKPSAVARPPCAGCASLRALETLTHPAQRTSSTCALCALSKPKALRQPEPRSHQWSSYAAWSKPWPCEILDGLRRRSHPGRRQTLSATGLRQASSRVGVTHRVRTCSWAGCRRTRGRQRCAASDAVANGTASRGHTPAQPTQLR